VAPPSPARSRATPSPTRQRPRRPTGPTGLPGLPLRPNTQPHPRLTTGHPAPANRPTVRRRTGRERATRPSLPLPRPLPTTLRHRATRFTTPRRTVLRTVLRTMTRSTDHRRTIQRPRPRPGMARLHPGMARLRPVMGGTKTRKSIENRVPTTQTGTPAMPLPLLPPIDARHLLFAPFPAPRPGLLPATPASRRVGSNRSLSPTAPKRNP